MHLTLHAIIDKFVDVWKIEIESNINFMIRYEKSKLQRMTKNIANKRLNS